MSSSQANGARPSTATIAGVWLFYIAVALAWSYPLLWHARDSVEVPQAVADAEGMARIGLNDQLLSIWGASHNGSALARGDLGGLIDPGICYPLPKAAALGEHMIELGVLGAPFSLVTSDPILVYNLACLSSLFIAGMSAFLLIVYWSGSVGAGVIAGLLFAFHPARLNDLIHPAVVGTHWMPLVILFFEQLLRGGRLRSGVFLGLAATLHCLTGSYPLLAFGFFALPFAAVRLLQQRRLLSWRTFSALVIAFVIVAVVVGSVLLQYANVSSLWQLFGERRQLYVSAKDLLPGGRYAVGLIGLLLAAWALVRRQHDSAAPHLAVLLGTLACVWVCSSGPLWQGGPQVTSPYEWLSRYLPFLTYGRVPGNVRYGVYFGVSLLAGLGVAHLAHLLRGGARLALTAVLVLAIGSEVFIGPLTHLVYGVSTQTALRRVRPAAQSLEAYASFAEHGYGGPLLDLPLDARPRIFATMAKHTLLAAYHRQPIAACYNSYTPATFTNVARMAARLPQHRAFVELAAAGLRNIVLHPINLDAKLIRGILASSVVSVLYRSNRAIALHINELPTTQSDPASLSATRLLLPTNLKPARNVVAAASVVFANHSVATWRLEHPVAPVAVRYRWIKIDRSASDWVDAVLLMPLALAGGEEDEPRLRLRHLPPPGRYTLEVVGENAGRSYRLSGETTVAKGWPRSLVNVEFERVLP